MNETRGIVTITEELTDLRRYLSGLPKQLVDTGAFGAYQKRESLLQEELIAAQIYRIVGQPTSPAAEPFSGLRGTMADVQTRMSEFQESLRRIRVRDFAEFVIPAIAILATVAAAYCMQTELVTASALLAVAVVSHSVYSVLRLRAVFAVQLRRSRDIERLRCDLEAYSKAEDTENPTARTQREVLLTKARYLAEDNAGNENLT